MNMNLVVLLTGERRVICAELSGWIDFTRDIRKEKDTIEKMTNTLAKRGPDETNIWIHTHVGFGHKRLIVVDPEGGRQPMSKQKEGKDLHHLLQW